MPFVDPLSTGTNCGGPTSGDPLIVNYSRTPKTFKAELKRVAKTKKSVERKRLEALQDGPPLICQQEGTIKQVIQNALREIQEFPRFRTLEEFKVAAPRIHKMFFGLPSTQLLHGESQVSARLMTSFLGQPEYQSNISFGEVARLMV